MMRLSAMRSKLAVLAGMLGLLAGSASGQDATGKIAGSVTDPSGAVVAGAKVAIVSLGTKIAKETTTDKDGYYQVVQLPIGSYEVAAEAAGFNRVTTRPQGSLEINQTLRVDVVLQVGSVSNTISVESTASIVETQNATFGGTVTGNAIYELPLNGRNTLDLLATQPGVTPVNTDTTGAGAYSIGGGRSDSVTFLLDGGNNNNLLNNAVVANPNPDAIAEFRVLQSNYGAEYGRNAGGVVSIVTKSGTNSLHGTLYDYVRNNALNANTFFNNEQGLERPILKRNQYGGTIGGPIFIPKVVDGRNKLFFFFAYQGQRQTALVQDGKTTTFTPLEAQGNFSQSVNGGPDPAVASFLAKNPFYQPDPAQAAQGIIDTTKIDPVAQAYFKGGLIPTSASGFLFPQSSALDNVGEYLGKIDFNFSTRDSVSGTFTMHNEPRTSPFANSNVSGYTSSRETTSYFGNVAYTHTFTPSLLNELRITAQRNNNLNAVPTGPLAKVTSNSLGIGNTPDVSTGPTMLGFGGKNLNTGFSPNGPTNLIDNTYSYSDNVSWTRGRHSMKYGFNFSPYQNNTVYDYYINGEFFFYGPSTSVGSGNDFADFMLGLPDEYLQFPKAPSNIRTKAYAGFAQDEWHMRKNLTLTFGLRYEYAQPKFDTQGRSFSLVPGLQSTRFPNAPTGLVFPGDRGAPKGSNYSDKNDFAPRLGFAWDVFGNGKTSVRGGGGVFYDILKAEDNLQFNGQAPFFGFADLFFNFPDPAQTSNPGYLSTPFQSSGNVNTFPSKPPANNIDFVASGFTPIGGGGVYFVDPHLRTPYTFQYNLSIQQELASNLVLEAGYVGYSAHKLTALVDSNPFVQGTNTRLLNTPGAPALFSYLDTFKNVSNAGYSSLETTLTKRFGGSPDSLFADSFFSFSHTWSHEIDNASGFRQRNSLVPYYGHNLLRASGDADLRHFLSLSGGWDLPFQKLWSSGPKLLTKGWSLYPIVTYRTGFALDVFAGLSTSRSDPGPSGSGDAGIVRADLTGASINTYDPKHYQTINGTNSGSATPGNYYFDPNAFSTTRLIALDSQSKTSAASLNGQYTYGTFPRNAFRGPGRTNFNLSLAKHFYLRENVDLEVRADAFNLLNSVQFQNPNISINDPNFGQVSGTEDPRIVQVAAHLRF